LQYIKIPKLPIWHGEEAIEALHENIKEFEQQRGKELTDKQADAMIKLAKGLISSIEAEVAVSKSRKSAQGLGFVARLKASIMKPTPDSSLSQLA